MKKHLFFLLAGAALLAPCTALADPVPDRAPEHQNLWRPRALREKLGLTDDQVAKIKTEFANHKDALRSGAAKVREARAQFRATIQNNSPEPQIRSAATALGAAEGDLGVARAALFASIKPILTPEQLAKLQTLQSASR